MARIRTLVVSIATLLSVIGCGGMNETDMRRYAIRRPPEEEDERPSSPKPLAEDGRQVPSQDQDAAADPNVTKKLTARDQASSLPAANSPTSSPIATPPSNADSTSNSQTTGGATSLTDTRQPDASLSTPARRELTIANLKHIVEAIEAYRTEHGTYPPRAIFDKSGQPLLSWRVLLLPQLGYQSLYDAFHHHEPWDSPHNERLIGSVPSVFQSPDRFDTATNYQLPIAPSTAFYGVRGKHPRRWEDGIKNTVIVVEVDDSNAVPWTAPEDLNVNFRSPSEGLGHLRSDGTFVGWGGASVGRIPTDTPTVTWKSMFTVDGGESFSAASVSKRAKPNPQLATSSGVSHAGRAANGTPLQGLSEPTNVATPTAYGDGSMPAMATAAVDSYASRAAKASLAGHPADAIKFAYGAFLIDEPGSSVKYQWIPAIRRPATALRFGVGVNYVGEKAAAIADQLNALSGSPVTGNSLSRVVGDLAGAVMAQLAENPRLLPTSIPSKSDRNGQQSSNDAEMIGVGRRSIVLRAANQDYIDVVLMFDVQERQTRNGTKTHSVDFSVIDAWRGRDLISSQTVNYLKRERESSHPLFEDPVNRIAVRFSKLLRAGLRPQPIPLKLQSVHAKQRVQVLIRRKRVATLAVLSEIKFYRTANLISTSDLMLAFQSVLDKATGTELMAGTAFEKKRAIERWLPQLSTESWETASRVQRDDDD